MSKKSRTDKKARRIMRRFRNAIYIGKYKVISFVDMLKYKN